MDFRNQRRRHPGSLLAHETAFKSDQFSNFMLAGQDDPAHRNFMKPMIEHWLSDPTAHLIKAVAGDGDIVGLACWIVKEPLLPKPKDRPKNDDEKASVDESGGATWQPPKAKPLTLAQLIGVQMRDDLMKWEDQINGQRHYVVQALATSSRYQRQGVTFQIIQWGVDRADAEGAPCWIHASPAGWHLYSKAGFQELGSNEYDLGKWGKYTFRYMLRPPAS